VGAVEVVVVEDVEVGAVIRIVDLAVVIEEGAEEAKLLM